MRDLFWFQGMLGGAKAQYETTYSWELDYTADIAKCNVPLLVIHCEDDQIVPIDPTGRRVPAVVPHAILKVYPGGAHGIAIIDPERVNADLLAFINGEMKEVSEEVATERGPTAVTNARNPAPAGSQSSR